MKHALIILAGLALLCAPPITYPPGTFQFWAALPMAAGAAMIILAFAGLMGSRHV